MPTATSAGVPIHYQVVGEDPPLVLVHGFASSLEGNWAKSGWIDFLVAQDVFAVMDAVAPSRSW